MKIVEVKSVRIGEGRPKICVPIIGAARDELVLQGKSVLEAPVDIVEWRGDYFPDIFQKAKAFDALKALREIIPNIPLLFTFRSAKEGGARDISLEEYSKLNKSILSTGCVDLIDVEAFTGEEIVKDIIGEAQDNGVKVIASNHDFYKTPPKEEIIKRLRYMQDLGADICKIALMPENKRDTLTVLDATLEMCESYGDTPIITISMGGDGVISRLSGEIFGSAVTFGSLDKASAPGQIKVKELSQLLDILHNSLKQ
ncbi:type I 3-dehydroquinate dehydratase [Alloiococcus sp. CFN-8]|uniref:type I 3-dehydroquinate dehydratase n=1 Tax=Alloiococcus sp. CFN-8 TaxID=3416081 RepID=UPI003CECFC39